MRAALLYPFSNLLEPGWGNSLRMNLLLAYLSERCEAVWTVSPARRAGEVRNGNVRHIFLAWPLWWQVYHFVSSKYWRLLYGRDFLAERNILRLFIEHKHIPSLRPLLETVIRQSAVVFLKYPFWASVVVPLCKQYGVPCMLTAIDVHAVTVGRDPEVKRKILDLELSALRSVDYAFCVSEQDQRFFEQQGLHIGCLVNPIDTGRCEPEANLDKIAQFRARCGLGSDPVCMFVGSRIVPNVEAVEMIQEMALRVPECQFVIAGRCARPGRDENVIKLGLLEAEALRALYTIADIVLIPLKTGTGTSLKFVEALAYGKPVLTSSVAARGYAVTSGQHALLADDFARYPTLIRDLLANKAKRATLARQARALAQDYDYRQVFQPYDALLHDLQLHSRGGTIR